MGRTLKKINVWMIDVISRTVMMISVLMPVAVVVVDRGTETILVLMMCLGSFPIVFSTFLFAEGIKNHLKSRKAPERRRNAKNI